jgi:hypothetical protein
LQQRAVQEQLRIQQLHNLEFALFQVALLTYLQLARLLDLAQ